MTPTTSTKPLKNSSEPVYDALRSQIRAFRPSCAQERADRELMLRAMEQYNDLLTRDNPVMHFTASSWIVSPARDRVLMVYHNIYRSWSWTGGHADGEPDMLTVAVKEAMEETGLRALTPVTPEAFSLEILNVAAHVKRGRHVSAHLHLNLTYLLEGDPSASLRCAPEENSSVAWFDPDLAIESSREPNMQVIYRKLNEKLRRMPC